ncbi:MAG TPA: tetratricopeptide repeat protein [Caldimonas sp.]|jgi:hypothetical protein|nr:tetratricopeptide repeat protein [Caldimonas sp.]
MHRQRGAVAAALVLALGVGGAERSVAAIGANERAALLDRAEATLARGDAAGALDDFERLAGTEHSADIEMGIVRAQMQLGEYRRALAFCAHVAGAHRDSPAAAALYAWLLRAGGQEAVARRVVAEALVRSPEDASLVAVTRAFALPLPLATGLLLEPPHRMAPRPSGAGEEPPAGARVVGGGVLVDAATALMPAEVLAGSAADPLRVWVRNGLGRTVRARVERGAQPLLGDHVVVLGLLEQIDAQGIEPPAAREPFAGSPGFVVEYAATTDATPGWPWLNQGFIGANVRGSELRQLGVEVAGSPLGGAVLDASGRLAGIALRGAGNASEWLPLARWYEARAGRTTAETTQESTQRAGDAPASTRLGADAAYERALHIALQVIVAP